MILNDMIDGIKKANDMIIVTHISPDGDGLGCVTAMYKAMIKINKNVNVFIDDKLPDIYRFLPYIEKITKPFDKKADLLFIIDCADENRMGNAKELLKTIPISINIDHHISNTLYATMNYVDTNAASSAEIIYQIIKMLGIDIDSDIAKCLYTGIVTDTGSFMYSSTTSFTHEVAGDLINNGVSVSEISDKIFHNIKFNKLKLIGKILNKIELYENNKIAYMEIKNEDFIETGTDLTDVENIINYGRDIDSVEVAVLLVENNDEVKGSLRSKNYINVNKIAKEFNGGGHVRASGFTINGKLSNIKEQILKAIKNELNEGY
ncbi:bifunctional oligoribonuclease/PAP phosphatase NrnA [Thermoanaerobacterium sp. RBIITD]|uniref:DHH family phosphoesterase n=1 Tax=Thermoanaerobacterium sp. RBIITD TaxID=1550240 RepID=UPI000BB7A866|nr:bifunctional oligoribonuclease/PAP phosphatase NrnA [Thermoanaerobacterium sp. RBIITD]SNX55472.1 phosphoesterase RecJ domain-containing protein [Thermoanaerobacterium sp. RBIITD]